MRPITFDGLFGWVHHPQGPRADFGVVLISPLGRDERCAHLPMRIFADRLAQAGYPTLRYDHRGEGDSLGLDDPEIDALPVWLEGVKRAIGELRAESGVQRVVLGGVRMGATLAAVSADAADGLILLAPILNGQSWLKRLRFASRAASTKARESGLDASGLVLSPATLASLSKVDLTRIPSIPAFVAAQNRMVEHYAAERSQCGAAVTVADFLGFEDMFLDAHSNLVPDAVFVRSVAWMTQTFGGTVVASRPCVKILESLRPPRAREHPVEFGVRLHGVLCDPETGAASTAVIFCNSGGDPRSGIGGFATVTARRLAALGVSSLRFDFAGLGDSPMDGLEPRSHVYEVSRSADMAAAVGLLAARGANRIIVVGVCAGAHHAFESATADPRITGLVAISPVKLVWRKGDSLSFGRIDNGKATRSYLQAMIDFATWKKLLTGGVDVVAVARVLTHRARERVDGWLARRRPASPLSKMRRFLARGGRVLFLMGTDDGSIDQMATHFGPGASELAKAAGVIVRIEPSLDHGLARQGSRELALKALEDWLGGL
jgi:alpha-beta hydrolase superfamily lysophospholipase